MYINNIKIRNFRSVESVSIKLNKLNMLCGPNSSGKSNILRAIDAAFLDFTDDKKNIEIWVRDNLSKSKLSSSAAINVEVSFEQAPQSIYSLANEIKDKHGEASLILSTNMFAHMATIGEVVSGIEVLLKEDGVFVLESHYLMDVIQGGQFDTIYHEHLRTYSLKSIIKLFSYYNFTITDVERGSRYGGNIRVHVTKGKNRPVSENVATLLNLEENSGLNKLKTYEKFADRVKKAKIDFMKFVLKIKEDGKTLVANSCPGRGVTLLNYYGVDIDLIPYIAEQPTSLKLGMFLPGKSIPVVNNEILIQEQPDYVLLLAWHYAEPIMKQLKARGLKSNFIIPLPDLKVIEN